MSSWGKDNEVGDKRNDLEFETDEDGEDISRPTKKQKCTSKESDDSKEVTSDRHISRPTKKQKCTSKVSDDSKEVTSDRHISRPTKKQKCSSKVCDDSIEVSSDRHCCCCSHENFVEEEHYSVETVSMPQPKPISAFEYDHDEVREKLSHLIIMDELPFRFAESKVFNCLMKSITHQYKKTSRAIAKKHCLAAFGLEKDEVMNDFDQENVNRVSVTTDLWRSGGDVSYMVVMCQFLDFDLNLQKRILNFCEVPPPHSGLVLSDVLHKCLVEWKIEKKVWTVTVDNAACNDVAVRILRENLSYNKKLPLNGKLFRVRCYAQMLNLVAQDGLSAIKDVIFKVRESVKYVAASETRIKMFSEIAKELELSSKKLVLDCCTRWNATVSMLSAALNCKDVFSKYQQRDTSYVLLPSEEEWEKVRMVCSFLEAFNQFNHLKPGTKCLTSNLFLVEFDCLKRTFSKINVGEDPCMREMVIKWKARLDKYWRDCNLLMCVAAVLDPRYKMDLIDFCFKHIYSNGEAVEFRKTVIETLRLLFNEYVDADKAEKAEKAKKAETDESSDDLFSSRFRYRGAAYDEFREYLKSLPRKSELDKYLEEETEDEGENFDALSWWRGHNQQYSRFQILSRMARDVLSIPLTTVTSDLAYDAGNRVVDPHYASMGVARAQVLLCRGEWLQASCEYKRSQENEGIQEIDLS